MMLVAKWTRVEGWASGQPEMRRVTVRGERRNSPVGLVVQPWAFPLKVQCGDPVCGVEFGRAWVGRQHVILRPGFMQDPLTGIWRLSRRAEGEWQRAARAGVVWANFEFTARRVAPAPSKGQPAGRPDLAPAIDIPLPVKLRCPVCKLVNEIVANPVDKAG